MESSKETPGIKSELIRVTGYKINIRVSIVFPNISNEQMGFNIKQTTLFITAQKKKYLTYKTNEIYERKLQNTEGKNKDLNKWNKIPCL